MDALNLVTSLFFTKCEHAVECGYRKVLPGGRQTALPDELGERAYGGPLRLTLATLMPTLLSEITADRQATEDL